MARVKAIRVVDGNVEKAARYAVDYGIKGSVRISELTKFAYLTEFDGLRNVWSITAPKPSNRVFYLSCESGEEVQGWKVAIHNLLGPPPSSEEGEPDLSSEPNLNRDSSSEMDEKEPGNLSRSPSSQSQGWVFIAENKEPPPPELDGVDPELSADYGMYSYNYKFADGYKGDPYATYAYDGELDGLVPDGVQNQPDIPPAPAPNALEADLQHVMEALPEEKQERFVLEPEVNPFTPVNLESEKLTHAFVPSEMTDESRAAIQKARDQMEVMNIRDDPKVHGSDWNRRWLSIQKRQRHGDLTMDSSMALGNDSQQLQDDFFAEVLKSTKTIIRETRLKIEDRTIKPIDVGGVAGGLKYIHNGIMYKFALDERGLYGGDENAMKAASLEFNATSSIYNTHTDDVNTPLTAIVDWLGFRISASCLLPLGPNTLVYGSADAAKTMHDDIPKVSSAMASLGSKLNLKAHKVEGRNKTVTIYGPADVEGHVGTDGFFYLIDTHRMMPPQPPRKGLVNPHLYHHFRPEFVKFHKHPLSSDAFSYFGRHHAKDHNREVRDAFGFLVRDVIPNMAKDVDALYDETEATGGNATNEAEERNQRLLEILKTPSSSALLDDARINDQMDVFIPRMGSKKRTASTAGDEVDFENDICYRLHDNGINLRYLGIIRRQLKNARARRWVLEETTARSLKSIFRTALRRFPDKLRGMRDETEFNANLHDYVLSVLNVIFGARSERTDRFWSTVVRTKLCQKFPGVLIGDETKASFDLRAALNMESVYQRFHSMIGLKLSEAATYASIPLDDPLTREDIVELAPVIRVVGEVPALEAMGLVERLKRTYSPEDMKPLIQLADDKFREALRSNPTSSLLLSNYASFHFRITHDLERARFFWERSLHYRPHDADTLGNLGSLYFTLMDYDKAEHYFERALEVNPHHGSNLFTYGTFLASARSNDSHPVLQRLRSEQFEVNMYDNRQIGNYAHFLHFVTKDYDRAEMYYKEAIAKNANDGQTIANFAAFMCSVRQQHSSAADLFELALKNNPDGFGTIVPYVRCLSQHLDQTEKARKLIEHGVHLYPNNARVLSEYATFLTHNKDYEKAESVYGLILSSNPSHVSALENLADLYENKLGDLVKAEALYKQFTEVCPKYAWSHMRCAQYLKKVGRIMDARVYYEKANEINQATEEGKRDRDIAYNYGNYLAMVGDLQGALGAYFEAHRIDATWGWPLVNSAQIMIRLGNMEVASQYLISAVQLQPESLHVVNTYVSFTQQVQGAERAAAAAKQLVDATNEAHWAPMYAYGRMLWLGCGRLSEGYGYLEKAVNMAPDEPAVLADFGLVLLAKSKTIGDGETKLATTRSSIPYFQKAISLEPTPTYAAYNLACVFGSLAEEENCRKWLQYARDRNVLPGREHIQGDEDFAAFSSKTWFTALLDGMSSS